MDYPGLFRSFRGQFGRFRTSAGRLQFNSSFILVFNIDLEHQCSRASKSDMLDIDSGGGWIMIIGGGG